MKNKRKILLLIASISLAIFMFVAVQNLFGQNVPEVSAKMAEPHEEAYNVWCKYFPTIEGCCPHSSRECTNQNFCSPGDC